MNIVWRDSDIRLLGMFTGLKLQHIHYDQDLLGETLSTLVLHHGDRHTTHSPQCFQRFGKPTLLNPPLSLFKPQNQIQIPRQNKNRF